VIQSAGGPGDGGPAPYGLSDARIGARRQGSVCRIVGRRDPRDVLLTQKGESLHLSALRPGARVIVIERRSGVLLRAFEPRTECLRSDSLEGALQRLDAGEVDAAILPGTEATAAGRESDIAEWLHQTSWIPHPARGFLARVEAPGGEAIAPELEAALAAEETVQERLAVVQERSDGVIGAIAIPFGEYLRLWAMSVSADGRRAVRVHRTGRQNGAVELGERVARELLNRGGRSILGGVG